MLETSIRKPAVAGKFYPANERELSASIREIYSLEKKNINPVFSEKKILGAVVPHAGYMFSAYQAVHFFETLKNTKEKIDTFVIINPNHTGYGEKIALDSHQFWNTPFGNVEQDAELIARLNYPFSNIAHQSEHSGEIMLPMLQYFLDYKFKVVLITLSQQNVENARELAKNIKLSAEQLNKQIMLIASSDFTHFKDSETGKALDDLVLTEIDNQHIDRVDKIIRQNNISVCGYGPIMCLMEYSRLSGNYQSTILARGHSGQIVSSDKVVNYITILFYMNQ